MSHVVVVEDDGVSAQLFQRVLERRGGHRVTVTQDVAELLRLVRGGGVHLVLMDVSLAHSVHEGRPVSGIEITRILKGDPATAAVPVLLATAHAMRGDDERLMGESQADGYVAKPIVDHEAFVAQVRELVERRRAA